jgi:acyl carrier protein phosphodiesterase
MNFLAHLYLSGDDDDLILGNFVADMVKGRQIESFHEGVVKGIRLHRKIDAFTDTHPVVETSKMRLRNKYRLYSGVVVDMFYDHFLAGSWEAYSAIPLVEFVDRGYSLLLNNYSILPPRARNVLPQMISGNWLVNYASLESLQQHFEGMARRTPFNSGMEHAVEDLKKYYKEFETEFHTFFPELISYVEKLGVSNLYHRPLTGTLQAPEP